MGLPRTVLVAALSMAGPGGGASPVVTLGVSALLVMPCESVLDARSLDFEGSTVTAPNACGGGGGTPTIVAAGCSAVSAEPSGPSADGAVELAGTGVCAGGAGGAEEFVAPVARGPDGSCSAEGELDFLHGQTVSQAKAMTSIPAARRSGQRVRAHPRCGDRPADIMLGWAIM